MDAGVQWNASEHTCTPSRKCYIEKARHLWLADPAVLAHMVHRDKCAERHRHANNGATSSAALSIGVRLGKHTYRHYVDWMTAKRKCLCRTTGRTPRGKAPALLPPSQLPHAADDRSSFRLVWVPPAHVGPARMQTTTQQAICEAEVLQPCTSVGRTSRMQYRVVEATSRRDSALHAV